jgi:glycosyltransferase involved in cell wall biosynthesis
MQASTCSASIVISVYKDVSKLECILRSFEYQSEKNFEVIVSEDGESAEMEGFLSRRKYSPLLIRHLTQSDNGFRKNRALNRAICAAKSDSIIFIDGDCVPHINFVAAHLANSSRSAVSAGRRVELGIRASSYLIKHPSFINVLSDPLKYLMLAPLLIADSAKNPEAGLASKYLHHLSQNKALPLVGCNFSARREILEAVNGFNEDYEAPGIGEDSDLEWRLLAAGFRVQNIKFLAPLFHLYHPRSYGLSTRNTEIFEETKKKGEWRAMRGLTARSEVTPPSSTN